MTMMTVGHGAIRRGHEIQNRFTSKAQKTEHKSQRAEGNRGGVQMVDCGYSACCQDKDLQAQCPAPLFMEHGSHELIQIFGDLGKSADRASGSSDSAIAPKSWRLGSFRSSDSRLTPARASAGDVNRASGRAERMTPAALGFKLKEYAAASNYDSSTCVLLTLPADSCIDPAPGHPLPTVVKSSSVPNLHSLLHVEGGMSDLNISVDETATCGFEHDDETTCCSLRSDPSGNCGCCRHVREDASSIEIEVEEGC
jgi:hypothetical protein